MNTQEHLNRIKAKCQELLAIAEKRTAGNWNATQSWVGSENSCIAATKHFRSDGDAAFIASCAGAAEAGWKSTIATIDALQDLANQCDYFSDGSPDASPRDKFANELEGMIDYAINQIIAAWPQELL